MWAFVKARICGLKRASFQHTLAAVLALSDVLGSFSFMVSTPWFLKSDPRLVTGMNRTVASEDEEPLVKGRVGVGARGAEPSPVPASRPLMVSCFSQRRNVSEEDATTGARAQDSGSCTRARHLLPSVETHSFHCRLEVGSACLCLPRRRM